MPAQVLVVKRARRPAFALLWAAPAWLRSIWSALRETSGEAERTGVDLGLAARMQPLHVPRLRLAEDGAHVCTGCGICPEICPSRCLSLATMSGKATVPREVIRFELDLGACIGCARCIDECPENALEPEEAPRALAPSIQGRPEPVDLLALGEK